MLPDLLQLGPFVVEDGTRLRFREPGCRPQFSFQWRKRRFDVVLADGEIAMSGVLGKIPSTSGGGETREHVFALLRGLTGCLPPGWALRLTPEHRIQVASDQSIDWPTSAVALLQPVVAFLLQLAPFLDLLEEEGV